MKRLFTILAAVLLTASVFAQSPEKMSYQAVIRNSSNQLVVNQAIGMQISILQGSASGLAVYVETQTPTTNANGLVSIEIGAGITSDDFSDIDWENGPYFIKTETAVVPPLTTYTITGTSQLLSVSYAMHAKTAENGITIAQADAITANTAKISAAVGTATGQMQYWDGSEWITVAAGNEGQMLSFAGGVPTWTTVVGVTTVGATDAYNPTTGKIWMDRNLGASQVATSSTDYLAYGDLYQWGRASDGHQTIVWTSSTASDGAEQANETATLSTTDTPGHGDFITNVSSPYDWRSGQNANLWQDVNGTNNPCPSGYRLPTAAELEAERLSWAPNNNAAGAFGSPLKLPVAGYRNYNDGSLSNVGSFGGYWSSTVDGISSRVLLFNSSNATMFTYYRAYGYSVRCLKN